MKYNLTVAIKKRNQPEFLIWLIIILPFAFGTLFDLLSFPSFFKYVLDAVWIFLLGIMLKRSKSLLFSGINVILLSVVIAYLAVTLIVYAFNYQSILYYLWGIRNNFRYYVFFFACIVFLNQNSIDDYFVLFDKLFWVNFAVCIVQFFVFRLRGDYLGGIFGVAKGCNAYTNILLVIVAIKSLVYYLNKLETAWVCIAKCIAMLVISALAEIKFFFIEFFIILIMAIFLTSFSWRKLAVVLAGAVSIAVGVYVLTIVFPTSAEVLSFSGLLDLATSEKGYTSDGDVNRLTTIPIISKMFLTSVPQKLFGLGLGNCDTAAYSFLQTPFYLKYSSLNYTWFSSAFVFLETGFIGLTFFFGFFVLVFVLGRKVARKSGANKIYCYISSIFAICCILIAIYNSSLRMESGYMAYFVLALPFVESAKPQGDVVENNLKQTFESQETLGWERKRRFR